ncbi:hypothetical protein F2Q68_00005941 [Brassica cretica]|uniref:Uncharacterized protein n=1 Tax=Brassica cretica TaxID=69181 RepID=A0A8S9JDD1_BRACR|nr:hypothetical protein F2Q68_00005941 [Brassica cretica]
MYRGVNKIESFTVAELNKYVLNSPLQSTEFLCDGKSLAYKQRTPPVRTVPRSYNRAFVLHMRCM